MRREPGRVKKEAELRDAGGYALIILLGRLDSARAEAHTYASPCVNL